MAEYFETYDDDGNFTGLVTRDVVHASGLWHKSAHVFLFNARGELFVQRRAVGKDLHPNRWDVSVGEHLQPGENYLDGALRGLREELGVTGVTLEPLLGVQRASFRIEAHNVFDQELQQAFRGRYDGPLAPDAAEVAAVESVRLDVLAAWIGRAPTDFTPWFLSEIERLGLLTPTPP